jgi:hypothetical protein
MKQKTFILSKKKIFYSICNILLHVFGQNQRFERIIRNQTF